LWIVLKKRKRRNCKAIKCIQNGTIREITDLNFSGYQFMAERNVEIFVCRDSKSCADALDKLSNDCSGKFSFIVGFDVEWVKSNKIAILQLSSERICMILQMQALNEEKFPRQLIDFLENKKIIKVGVGIDQDVLRISKDYGISIRGAVDLRALVQRSRYSDSLANYGLHKLTRSLLNLDISKDYRIRCGNWENESLDDDQLLYAAADAFFSKQIYQSIFFDKFSSKDLGEESDIFDFINSTSWGWVKGIVDVSYKPVPLIPNHVSSASLKQDQMSDQEKAMRKLTVRKLPLYENCKIFSPDGVLLSTCSEKKVKWYLDRNLATLLPRQDPEEPSSIQLNFVPKGQGHAGNDFYLSAKDNICVVCGDDKKYIRFRVFPACYRKNCPESIKSHQSHDIVLLCPPCAIRANDYVSKLQAQVGEEFGVPMNGIPEDEKKIEQWNEFSRIKTKLASFLANDSKIPRKRFPQILEHLKKYATNHEPQLLSMSDDDLVAHISVQSHPSGIETKPVIRLHGQLVMGRILSSPNSDTELSQFIQRWRDAFLSTMNPKHLSPHWANAK
jgi:hypothetical protein